MRKESIKTSVKNVKSSWKAVFVLNNFFTFFIKTIDKRESIKYV